MKKQKLGLALAAVLLLSGCGGIEKMTETTVTVDDKGTVEELLLEDFSDETYNEEELTAQINELVEAYNKEAGSEAVSVKSMQVKDKQAKYSWNISLWQITGDLIRWIFLPDR